MEKQAVNYSVNRVVNQSKNMTYEAAKANVIKSFKSGDDDDVVAVCSVLSVRCPLGLCVIDLPVRGINCEHLQCFDLKTFLVFQESARSQAWRCIVCDKRIHLSELRIDPFWKQLLHDVADDEELELVEIFPDATWKKHTPIDKREKKPNIQMTSRGAAPTRLVSTDAIDLTLWSDDDEHPVTKTSLWSPKHLQGPVNDKRSTRSSTTAPRQAQLAPRHRRSSGSNTSLELGFEDLNISGDIQAAPRASRTTSSASNRAWSRLDSQHPLSTGSHSHHPHAANEQSMRPVSPRLFGQRKEWRTRSFGERRGNSRTWRFSDMIDQDGDSE
ncbi:hypothetical protein AC1031_018219 [Aphanomyces cochlioides]|nr:hypothetical protein AC1031_018219 [Aphanomyces cochlioides]